MSDKFEETFNTSEAARYLRCSESKMLDLARRGRVKAAKIGKEYVFRNIWLTDFLEREAERASSTETDELEGARPKFIGANYIPPIKARRPVKKAPRKIDLSKFG